jgi:ABC-type methionine transport system permease subunit
MRWSSIKAGGIGWVTEYQRRMRRFNLEVIFAALIALTILIAQIFIEWWAFSK